VRFSFASDYCVAAMLDFAQPRRSVALIRQLIAETWRQQGCYESIVPVSHPKKVGLDNDMLKAPVKGHLPSQMPAPR
jgi:hypothetical protein